MDRRSGKVEKASAPGPRLLSLKAASEYVGLSLWSLRELIWSGNLPVVRLPGGRKQFLDTQDLEAFIKNNKELVE